MGGFAGGEISGHACDGDNGHAVYELHHQAHGPDLGNLSAWPENDAEAELSAGAGSIVAVHLKDTLRVSEGFGGKFRGVPFGSGCVDFVKLFSRLESQGYNGPYLMEMWHEEGKSDIVETGRAKAWLEAGFALAVGRS